MKRLVLIFIAVGICWMPLTVKALIDDAGTNNPFEYGAGSRALSMAGAYVAIADDVSAMFWNPAGLAQLQQIEVSAMHIQMFFETPYDFIGVAYPLLDWGTFAFGAIRIATDGIILRDARSNIISDQQGSMDMREYLLSYARETIYGIQAGINLKLDQQRLLGDYATGIGFDTSFIYRLPKINSFGGIDWENFSVGLMFQNILSGDMKLKNESDQYPLSIKAGLAYRYLTNDSLKQKIIISGAWEKSTWRYSQFSIGLEYGLLDMFALRGGLNNSSWTAGGGAYFMGVMLDYALAAEDLGLTHRFTLSYRFGTPIGEQLADREKKRMAELDKEAEKRALAAVKRTKEEMEIKIRQSQSEHLKEKKAMLVKRQRLLANERRRSLNIKKTAAADEYFKALHYFQGIKDYLKKDYKAAILEFETVGKYDENYLELQLYSDKAHQRMTGGRLMSGKNMALYYQGIDLYVEEKFEEAIAIWKKIRQTEPNNILVLRNIEEAEDRLAKLQSVRKELEDEEAIRTEERKNE